MAYKMELPEGGFVLHNMQGIYKGSMSAWYDKDGVVLDAEQLFKDGTTRPVKYGGPMWDHARIVGKQYLISTYGRYRIKDTD